jgi:hypothetical protein
MTANMNPLLSIPQSSDVVNHSLSKEAKFKSPVPFSFQYLADWTLSPLKDDIRCRVLRLRQSDDEADRNEITLCVRKREPADARLSLANEYADELKRRQFHVTGAPVLPLQAPEGYLYTAVCQLTVQHDGHKLDSPLLLLEHSLAHVVLGVLGPAFNESPEWWAINKRAFEIVRDSLTIG